MELMIIIAIISLVGMFAYPGLLKFRANARTRGTASDIFSAFRAAQTEAVKRNTSVCMKFNKAAGTYTTFIDDGAGTGTEGDCTQNGDEQTLYSKEVQPGTSISSVDFGDTVPSAVGFTNRGRPYNFVSDPTHFLSVQNDSNPSLKYKISLNIAGRVDIEVM